MDARSGALKRTSPIPLRCLDDAGRSLDASTLTAAEWTALTATNRQVRHLRTLCCGSPLVLKTSRLGTRFFAHLALGGCASGDESPEHLHLKALAIAAARAAGWTAEAEVAGTTPGGEPWRADVLATRGRHRVAVEVQWSGQADDETRRRQARYAASGVRGLWLFRRPGFLADADVPALRVGGSLAGGLTILGRPAAEALAAAFGRRLRFGIPAGAVAAVTVVGGVAPCWGSDCGALSRAVTAVEVAFAASTATLDLAAFGGHLPLLVPLLPPDRTLGRVRRRADGMALAGCFHCDRPLTRCGPASRFTIAAGPLAVTAEWAALIAAQPGYRPAWGIAAAAASA